MSLRSRAPRELIVACVSCLVVGCAAAPHVIIPSSNGMTRTDIEGLLAAHPLGPTENVRPALLGQTELMSYHLVQIRDRETPHVHTTHDLTVTLLRGKGVLHLRGAAQEMRAGDTAVIPRGTPHYFVNTISSPAVAFVTFAPPYDGTDQVPVAR